MCLEKMIKSLSVWAHIEKELAETMKMMGLPSKLEH
jgi:hypothetical protein